jgi:nitrogen fixation protein NifU and related proteins
MLNPAAEFDYHPRVRQLFADLQHAGALANAPNVISAHAGSQQQGFGIWLWVEVHAAQITVVRYQAYGCPHFLAACEWLSRWLEGREFTEVTDWRWRDVETELAVPAGKRARLLVLEEVLTTLLKTAG